MCGLPGRILVLVPGSVCDEHTEALAVKCVQGETDSFGHESLHMCQACFDNYKEELKKPQVPHQCDWCKKVEVCSPARDYSEGLSGPVYDVCQACHSRQTQSLIDEENCNRRNDDEDENTPPGMVIYYQGYNAAIQGKPLSSNPYSLELQKSNYLDWNSGWEDSTSNILDCEESLESQPHLE